MFAPNSTVVQSKKIGEVNSQACGNRAAQVANLGGTAAKFDWALIPKEGSA